MMLVKIMYWLFMIIADVLNGLVLCNFLTSLTILIYELWKTKDDQQWNIQSSSEETTILNDEDVIEKSERQCVRVQTSPTIEFEDDEASETTLYQMLAYEPLLRDALSDEAPLLPLRPPVPPRTSLTSSETSISSESSLPPWQFPLLYDADSNFDFSETPFKTLMTPVFQQAQLVITEKLYAISETQGTIIESEVVTPLTQPVTIEATNVICEEILAKFEMQDVKTDAGRVIIQAPSVLTEASSLICEVELVISETQNGITDAGLVLPQTSPVIRETEIVVSEMEDVIIEAGVIIPQMAPDVTESKPIITEEQLFTTESSLVDVEDQLLFSESQLVFTEEPSEPLPRDKKKEPLFPRKIFRRIAKLFAFKSKKNVRDVTPLKVEPSAINEIPIIITGPQHDKTQAELVVHAVVVEASCNSTEAQAITPETQHVMSDSGLPLPQALCDLTEASPEISKTTDTTEMQHVMTNAGFVALGESPVVAGASSIITEERLVITEPPRVENEEQIILSESYLVFTEEPARPLPLDKKTESLLPQKIMRRISKLFAFKPKQKVQSGTPLIVARPIINETHLIITMPQLVETKAELVIDAPPAVVTEATCSNTEEPIITTGTQLAMAETGVPIPKAVSDLIDAQPNITKAPVKIDMQNVMTNAGLDILDAPPFVSEASSTITVAPLANIEEQLFVPETTPIITEEPHVMPQAPLDIHKGPEDTTAKLLSPDKTEKNLLRQKILRGIAEMSAFKRKKKGRSSSPMAVEHGTEEQDGEKESADSNPLTEATGKRKTRNRDCVIS